ncbi:hypothetical protein GH733_014071 [Mirounga leonina]|nr:hypothetical protein GH733_014071 [Mirounga leonina]
MVGRPGRFSQEKANSTKKIVLKVLEITKVECAAGGCCRPLVRTASCTSSLSSDDPPNLHIPNPSDRRADMPSSKQSDEEEIGADEGQSLELAASSGPPSTD